MSVIASWNLEHIDTNAKICYICRPWIEVLHWWELTSLLLAIMQMTWQKLFFWTFCVVTLQGSSSSVRICSFSLNIGVPYHLFGKLIMPFTCRLSRCTLITTGEDGPIPRCKPFKYAYEKEIVIYPFSWNSVSCVDSILIFELFGEFCEALTDCYVCIFQEAGLFLHRMYSLRHSIYFIISFIYFFKLISSTLQFSCYQFCADLMLLIIHLYSI